MFICFTVKLFFADDNVHIFVKNIYFIMGLGIITTSQLLLFISALYSFILMIRIRRYLLHTYVYHFIELMQIFHIMKNCNFMEIKK